MVWSQAPIYHRDRLLRDPGPARPRRWRRCAARCWPRAATRRSSRTPSATSCQRRPRHGARDRAPTSPRRGDWCASSTRPSRRRSTCSATRATPRQRDLRALPLLGINSYFGWYPGKAAHPTARLADLGPFLDRMRAMYRGSGLVVTEFGAESTFAGPASEKETYAFQTRYIAGRAAPARPRGRGWAARSTGRCASSPSSPHWDGGARPVRPARRDPQQGPDLLRRACASPRGRPPRADFARDAAVPVRQPDARGGPAAGRRGAARRSRCCSWPAGPGRPDRRPLGRGRHPGAAAPGPRPRRAGLGPGARAHRAVSPSTALIRVIRAARSTAPPGSTRTSSVAPREAAILRQRSSAARPVESTNSTRVRSSSDPVGDSQGAAQVVDDVAGRHQVELADDREPPGPRAHGLGRHLDLSHRVQSYPRRPECDTVTPTASDSGRELDGDDVAVAHHVVAALHAAASPGRARLA